jgi:ribosomal peptide maturation radical SAM protein 1
MNRKIDVYAGLSRSFPWNEWIFVKQVFPDFRESDEQPSQYGSIVRALRERAASMVEAMSERLGSYDIVGISTVFWQSIPALALAKRVKQVWPDKIVVLGGANCEDVMGRAVLEQFPFVDYVFSGEVDFSFPEFVQRISDELPVDDVPGIVYRNARGEVAVGPAAPPLRDLDSLPIPDYDDYFSEVKESRTQGIGRRVWITLESSRGCWWGAKHHCTFCGLNGNMMTYREKSQERFQWELEEAVRRYGADSVLMSDNIMSMSYFNGFARWMKERRLALNWYFETKANLNREHVEALSNAGITWIQPGIESFSSATLALMDKGVKGIQNVGLLKYMHENGVVATYFILGGFPGEDPAEYELMERRLRKLYHLQPPVSAHEISFERFSPYHQAPEKYGLVLRTNPKYAVLYPFGEDVLSKLAYHFVHASGSSFPYFEKVKLELKAWQKAHRAGSTLRWKRDGCDIRIFDRRSGFPHQTYRLREYAADVFRALDRPATLASLVQRSKTAESAGRALPSPAAGHRRVPGRMRSEVASLATRAVDALRWRGREIEISFTREEFDADPERTVAPLVDAAILYEDDGWYVSLPVGASVAAPRLGIVHRARAAFVQRLSWLAAGLSGAPSS